MTKRKKDFFIRLFKIIFYFIKFKKTFVNRNSYDLYVNL